MDQVTVAVSRKTVTIAVLIIVAVVLALAWIDGGREEQHMIVQPVELPAAAMESGA